MLKDFQQLTIKVVNLVNSPRKTQRIIRDATVPRMILKDFIEALKAMEAKGFFLGSLSEVSLRAKGGKLVITPMNMPVYRINEETLLTAAILPDIVNQQTEFPRHIDWHRTIYSKCVANAVVVCQPVFACLLAGKGQMPSMDFLAEAAETVDSVQCLKSTDIQFEKKAKLGDEGLFLIQSIGVLAWGKNLDEVLSRIELIERICEIQIKSEGCA